VWEVAEMVAFLASGAASMHRRRFGVGGYTAR